VPALLTRKSRFGFWLHVEQEIDAEEQWLCLVARM
jgi:hypothetical protein